MPHLAAAVLGILFSGTVTAYAAAPIPTIVAAENVYGDMAIQIAGLC